MALLNVNFCQFAGRLTGDPELKTTQSGKSVATFSLAVEQLTGKQGERKADFVNNITVWEGTAESLVRNAKKGDLIMVNCRYSQDSYTDKDGNNRTRVSFTVLPFGLQMVDCKGWGNKSGGGTAAPAANNAAAPAQISGGSGDFSELNGDDDDLPF